MTRAIAAALLIAALPFGGKAHRETARGNVLYEDGDLEAALQAYTEAGVAAPDAPEVQYNIGNVLYRQGDWAGAREQYARAEAAAAPALRPDASFNLGNALFRQEDYAGAARAYRRVLEERPDDEAAKRNLELALRALETDPPTGGGDRSEDDQDDRDEEESEPESGESGSPRPQPGAEAEEGDESPEADEPSPADATEMTEQEAKRLLDRLEEEELEGVRRQLRRAPPGGASKREKDW